MKKVIIAPDSFKGCLTADEVCRIIEGAVLAHAPKAEVYKLPMADGGEGMVESYLATCGGERVETEVTGPRGAKVSAVYGILPSGVAVMEMAAAAGLPLAWGAAPPEQRSPMQTTTYGVGEMLVHAADAGITEVVLGLGGSATNDGGAGMAAALGYTFLDAEGHAFIPVGETLGAIAAIQKPERPLSLRVKAACDVDNPLCGPNGASHIFGPQKGATPQQVEQLDAGLQNLAAVIQRDLGAEVLELPGAGAAGGLGAGVVAFLDGGLQSGIDMLLDVAGYDAMLAGADVVFTGEGRIDGQSVRGKVPVGVAQRAKKQGVPCIALCGCVGDDVEGVYSHGITATFSSLRDNAPDFETIRLRAADDLAHLADSVVRVMLAAVK